MNVMQSAAGTAAVSPDPEVTPKAKRRSFSAAYKKKILSEADAAAGTGNIGEILRREGIYSSTLTGWRKERAAAVDTAFSQKRGPEPKHNPLAAENEKLRRRNQRLEEEPRKAEIIIDVQKYYRVRLDPHTCWTRNSDAGTLVRRKEWPSNFWCSLNP